MYTDDRVFYFDTAAEFAAAAESCIYAERGATRNAFGGSSWAQAVTHCANGDTGRVPDAERLIDRLNLAIDVPQGEWVPSPCGAFPIVPEFLAGRPDSMRRRVQAISDASPIRLVIDIVSSGSIDSSDLAARGVAFLALCMALARVRPVDVTAVIPVGPINGDKKSGIIVIPIGSKPFDVASACGVFANPGVCRLLGYGWHTAERGRTQHSSVHWYKGIHYRGDDKGPYVAAIRKALRLRDEDVYIGPAHEGDPLIRNPVDFVRERVAEHAARAES